MVPGDKHNKLTFVGMCDKTVVFREKRRIGRFVCECGKECIRPLGRVAKGYVRSCGCLNADNNLKHGMSNTPEYISWRAMKARCEDENHIYHHLYSHLVNDQEIMESFKAFFEEVGFRPSNKHSIDRIDNRLGYVRGNLQWATRKQQEFNKKKAYGVKIKGLFFESTQEASIYFKCSRDLIYRWCRGYLEHKTGKRVPPKEWAEIVYRYPQEGGNNAG